jgi:hypothetical protein
MSRCASLLNHGSLYLITFVLQLTRYPSEWTPVHIYPVILKLFAHMSARVMVGPELCKEWPAISLQYLNAALKAPVVVRQKYHPRLYWAAKYFSPEVKDINEPLSLCAQSWRRAKLPSEKQSPRGQLGAMRSTMISSSG